MANVLIIILAIVIILFFWLSGGSVVERLELDLPESDQTGIRDGDSSESGEKEQKTDVRIYRANAGAKDADNEYIELRADFSNTSPVNITGWTLRNRKGDTFTMPTAAGLPYAARVNVEEDIILKPGEKAVIVTGKSPIGASFGLNLCTGYFNDLRKFTPELPENCPAPDTEKGVEDESDACFLYLGTIPGCRVLQPQNIPSNVDFSCRDFINEHFSYASCVENHKGNPEFFSGEWRVYLEQNEAIWSEIRETIKLFDQNSNLLYEISI